MVETVYDCVSPPPHVRGAEFPIGQSGPGLSRAVTRERPDLHCRGSQYHFHSAKSEKTLAWDFSRLGLGPALEDLLFPLLLGSPLTTGEDMGVPPPRGNE